MDATLRAYLIKLIQVTFDNFKIVLSNLFFRCSVGGGDSKIDIQKSRLSLSELRQWKVLLKKCDAYDA